MKLTHKQREQLSRPRPLLFAVIVGSLCLPWIILLSANSYMRYQQKQIEVQANRFFSQISTHSGNLSGQQFDALGATLGLGPNASYSVPIFVNTESALAFQAIEPTLNQFLQDQSNKVSGPLEALPPELQHYLNTQRTAINQMRNHLLTSPAPRWDMDLEQMADATYPPPGFFNVRSVQKLLLLSMIEAHSKNQIREGLATSEAIWRLNQATAQRSDLSSQVSVSVISAQQASIFRHIPNIPTHWQKRLQEQAQHQPVMKGVRFEAWLRYEVSKASWIPTVVPTTQATLGQKIQATFANRFSPQTFFKLLSIDNTQTLQRALDQLESLDVCTTPQTIAEDLLSHIHTAFWNSGTNIAPSVLAKRWQTAGNRTLALELSQYVLQIKQQQETTGTWPDTFQSKPSQICPGEHWQYQRTDDDITISLSKELLSPTAIPRRYRALTQPTLTQPALAQPVLTQQPSTQ